MISKIKGYPDENNNFGEIGFRVARLVSFMYPKLSDQERLLRRFLQYYYNHQMEDIENVEIRAILKDEIIPNLTREDYFIHSVRKESDWTYAYGFGMAYLALRAHHDDPQEALKYIYLLGKVNDSRDLDRAMQGYAQGDSSIKYKINLSPTMAASSDQAMHSLSKVELDFLQGEGILNHETSWSEGIIKSFHQFSMTNEIDKVHAEKLSKTEGWIKYPDILIGEYRDDEMEKPKSVAENEVPEYMHNLVSWMNEQEKVIKEDDVEEFAAEVFIRFNDIHPFGDGNGRTGRLLLNAILLRHRHPPVDGTLINWYASSSGYRLLLPQDALHFASIIKRAQAGESTLGIQRYGGQRRALFGRHISYMSQVDGNDFLNWIRSSIEENFPPPLDLLKSIISNNADNWSNMHRQEFVRLLYVGERKTTDLVAKKIFAFLFTYFSSKFGFEDSKGGIDLTSDNLHVQTQSNNGEKIKFYLNPAKLAQMQNAPGFVPVIISIEPMTDLRKFLGIFDNLRADPRV